MIVFTEPQTIHVDNDWVRKNVCQIGNEVLCSDEEDLISQWELDEVTIKVAEFGDYINWVAEAKGAPVGAGSFVQLGSTTYERIQAVLPAYQNRGIFTSILEFIINWCEGSNIENDGQQTLAMQRIWRNMMERMSHA